MTRLFLVDGEGLVVRGAQPDLRCFGHGTLALDDPGFSYSDDVVAPEGKSDRASRVFAVRLWCRSAEGASVCVVIYDAVRTNYRKLKCRATDHTLGMLVQELRRGFGAETQTSVDVVERHTTQGWHTDPVTGKRRLFPWLRFRSRTPEGTSPSSQTRALLNVSRDAHIDVKTLVDVTMAETKVSVEMETLDSIGAKPGEWLELDAPLRKPAAYFLTDLLAHAKIDNVRRSEDQDGLPPLRVLSFDIECFSADGGFPLAERPSDACIAVGFSSETLFAEDARRWDEILVLRETAPLADGSSLHTFEEEEKLLHAVATVLQRDPPDIVVGYNETMFDWKYIQDRLDLLCGRRHALQLSKVTRRPCLIVTKQVTSSSMGDNPLSKPFIPGAFEIDLRFYLKRENRSDLPDLKLNTVAEFFLKDKKHDLPPKEIFASWKEGPEGRRRLAEYCLQDTRLVLALVKKLDVVQRVLLHARVTGVNCRDVLFRGEQIRVYSQILSKAHARGFVVEDQVKGDENDAADYEGAFVVDPEPGFFRDPIVCLDFASLYPSLQRTWNLSFDTLVVEKEETTLPTNDVPGTAHRFVSSNVERGLLPIILDELLTQRKLAKKEMSRESDPLKKSLLNSKQLALKISANSVYGFCGARRGLLSCLEVAESTTAAGRNIIHYTCDVITRDFPGSTIVYGDTDSCFVRLPEELRSLDRQSLFAHGERMAAHVNARFEETLSCANYVCLEMEKFFAPLILYCKKRYVGLCFEDPGKPGKMMARGIELVRRDSFQFVRTCQERLVNLLITDAESGAARAVEEVRAMVKQLLALEPGGDFALIAQSKSLKRDYKNEDGLPHVVVNKMAQRRCPGSEKLPGDRVVFVVVASETSRLLDKVESLDFARERGLPPDWSYYLEALEKPVLRVLEVPLRSVSEPLLESLRELFQKGHAEARAKLRRHSLARCETSLEWVPGHKLKSGGVQSKLPFQGVAVSAPRERRKPTRNLAEVAPTGPAGPMLAFVKRLRVADTPSDHVAAES